MTRRPLLLVLIWAAALMLPFLGQRSWWFPDEPDVALPIIEMHERGDWVVPTHNGRPWLDYQPLVYWGALAVAKVTGSVTEWGSRLPDALAALLMVVLACVLVRRRRVDDDERTLAMGAVLLSMPLVLWQAVNVHPDMPYAAAVTAGLALYAWAEDMAGSTAWAVRAGAFACLGLAWLGKGPLGLLLPGLVLTLWHAWSRQWWRILALGPLTLAALLVVLVWYAPLCHRLGFDYVWGEFQAQNFDRFASGTNRGHGGKPGWYYLSRLWSEAGLWAALVIPALVGGWRRRRQDSRWRLAALWFVAYFLFLTVAATKRGVYLLPALPALALLVVDWLTSLDEAAPWERWWWQILAWTLAVVLAVAGTTLVMAGLSWERVVTLPFIARPLAEADAAAAVMTMANGVVLMGAVLALGAGVAVRWLRLRAPALPVALVLSLSLGLAWMAGQALILPRVDTVRTYRPACAWLAERLTPGAELGFFDPGRENLKRAGFLTYLRGHPLRYLADETAVRAFLAADPKAIVVVAERRERTLPVEGRIAMWTISDQGWHVLGGADQQVAKPASGFAEQPAAR